MMNQIMTPHANIFIVYQKKGVIWVGGIQWTAKMLQKKHFDSEHKVAGNDDLFFFSYLDKSAADIKSNTKFIIIIKKTSFSFI